jgi:hypothetical protein
VLPAAVASAVPPAAASSAAETSALGWPLALTALLGLTVSIASGRAEAELPPPPDQQQVDIAIAPVLSSLPSSKPGLQTARFACLLGGVKVETVLALWVKVFSWH